MVVACWSVKGGSGTTVVAACLAVVAARVADRGTLLVDLSGDAPAALGVAEAAGAGIVDWLAAAKPIPVSRPGSYGSGVLEPGCSASTAWDLSALEQRVDDRLSVLPRGSEPIGSVPESAGEMLAKWLDADGRFVVVDAGTVEPGSKSCAAEGVIAAADRSLLVIRPCYLALRHVTRCSRRADGVVLVEEPGRSLSADDVASVTGAPISARLRFEPQVSRLVDAGLLCSRVPRNIERAMLAMLEA